MDLNSSILSNGITITAVGMSVVFSGLLALLASMFVLRTIVTYIQDKKKKEIPVKPEKKEEKAKPVNEEKEKVTAAAG
ncbi:OadG family protein [Spirochaetota bacterium]